jgi:thioredoxin-dependent peroxiredoxin
MQRTRFSIWAGLVALLAFGPVVAASESITQVGQLAPDFTLPSQDGSPVNLRDFRGRWIVLYFYPKDSTPGCTIEAHNLRDLSMYEQHHAVILGVSVDSTDSQKEFCAVVDV